MRKSILALILLLTKTAVADNYTPTYTYESIMRVSYDSWWQSWNIILPFMTLIAIFVLLFLLVRKLFG